MAKKHEFRFTIDAYSPDTLPMKRLAEYLTDLAVILGDPNNVHLIGIEEGSAVFVNQIDDEPAEKRIRQRVSDLREGRGPAIASNAFRDINSRLKEDNARGKLLESSGAEIIEFPGCDTPEVLSYGPFAQDGSLDGKVIMIGGVGDSVPVHVQQGSATFNCYATRDIAKRLGPYLFTTEIRVHGHGRWTLESGDWNLNRFTINRFEVLDDIKLSDAIKSLRQVEGSALQESNDPWTELISMRTESAEGA